MEQNIGLEGRRESEMSKTRHEENCFNKEVDARVLFEWIELSETRKYYVEVLLEINQEENFAPSSKGAKALYPK